MIRAGDQVLLILNPGLEDQITPRFAPVEAEPSVQPRSVCGSMADRRASTTC